MSEFYCPRLGVKITGGVCRTIRSQEDSDECGDCRGWHQAFKVEFEEENSE